MNTGHNILPYNVLRVFADISTRRTNSITFFETFESCNVDPRLLLSAKTPFRKKSVIDLAAESDGFALIRSFFQWLDATMEKDITEETARSMLFNGLLTALRTGAESTTSGLLSKHKALFGRFSVEENAILLEFSVPSQFY